MTGKQILLIASGLLALAQKSSFEPSLNCWGKRWPVLRWEDNEQNVLSLSCCHHMGAFSLSTVHGPLMRQVTMTPWSLSNMGIINRFFTPKMNHFSVSFFSKLGRQDEKNFHSSALIHHNLPYVGITHKTASPVVFMLIKLSKKEKSEIVSTWLELF